MTIGDPSQTPGGGDSRGTARDADRIRQAGEDMISDATATARSRLERSKSTAADSAASTSEVLDQAADNFSAHGQETLARATSMLAGKLSQLASDLENRSIDELGREARELARRNPGLFVAGGLAIGIALSRFFKASAESAQAGTAYRGDAPRYGAPAYGGEGAPPAQGSAVGSGISTTSTTQGGRYE